MEGIIVMDMKDVSSMEQAFADVTTYFVPAIRSFYLKNIEEGFTEDQAMRLTECFLKASCTNRKELK